VAAVLLGVLAVLASLFVGPAAATAQAGAASAATTSTVRGVPPLAIGQSGTRDHRRAMPRSGDREQSRLTVAVERPAAAGQGPTPFAAALGAPVLVAPLVAGFLAVRHQTGQVCCPTSGTRRDRAPPTLAFA
jgi:hypothetical protein